MKAWRNKRGFWSMVDGEKVFVTAKFQRRMGDHLVGILRERAKEMTT